MKEQIHKVHENFRTKLNQANSLEDLEHIRIEYLGRSGICASMTKEMRDLPEEQRRIIGPMVQKTKQDMTAELEEKRVALQNAAAAQDQALAASFDVTASKPAHYHGSLHIYTKLVEDLEDIFISMGYSILDGPEVETDFYNFEALNIPAHHPARDMQDTFWLDVPGLLLRTQTSPIQIRTMETTKPPLAIFAPGRVYRNESRDASHEFMFMQAECLFVDKNVSMGQLLYTTKTFLSTIFKKDTDIRVRPGYFPFVEPGIEIDGSCPFCTDGCHMCSHTGWIELLGAGLVHPNVLRAGGINPDVYSGFAFGFGLERLAMIKHGIRDIRDFKSPKIGILEQL